MHDKWQLPRSLGFSVFPIIAGTKKPAGKWGQWQTNHADDSLVAAWAANPAANVGIATGALSGCIVVDFDNDDAVAEGYMRGLPDTLMAKTPRGMHAYFAHPGGKVSNAASLAPGIDIRGDGGFVMAPGSYYNPTAEDVARGKRAGAYEWLNWGTPLADAPAWALEGHHRTDTAQPGPTLGVITPYRGPNRYGDKALAREIELLQSVGIGQGLNHQINKTGFAIGQLVAGGFLPAGETWDRLLEVALDQGDNPELDEQTLRNGWESGLKQPRVLPADETDHKLGGPPIIPPGALAAPQLPEGEAAARVGPAFRKSTIAASEMPAYFEGVVYVNSRDEFFTGQGQFLKRQAFDGTYGGPTFFLGAQGTTPTKSASAAFLTNEVWEAPRAHNTCFRPEEPAGSLITEEGQVLLNCYVPVFTRRIAGDAGPFIRHIEKLLPDADDREVLLHYMASLVQNPGVKFFWWPVIQGLKGNGKTLLLEVLSFCVGRRYTHLVNPEAMVKTGNQFNDWVQNKCLLGFEEIRTKDGKRDLLELLKPLVTNERYAVEGKGLKQTTIDNRANGIALTNFRDSMPVEDDERRYAIFFTAQQEPAHLHRDGMTGNYFPNLYGWLKNRNGYAIVNDWLHNFPLRAELDPARGATRAPRTTSTAEAISEGRGMLEQFILDAIDEGAPGFAGGVVSSKAVQELARQHRRTLPPKRLRSVMKACGYDVPPSLALSDGRATRVVQGVFGGKPRLYVEVNGPHWNCRDICEEYDRNVAAGHLGA